MTNKLVAVINSLKVPKTKKILLYEMKFLVPNYSCLQNPCLGWATAPRSPFSLPSTEFVEPPHEQNSWVRHWLSVPNMCSVSYAVGNGETILAEETCPSPILSTTNPTWKCSLKQYLLPNFSSIVLFVQIYYCHYSPLLDQ